MNRTHFKHSRKLSSQYEPMNHSILFSNQIFQHFHSVLMQGFDIDIWSIIFCFLIKKITKIVIFSFQYIDIQPMNIKL